MAFLILPYINLLLLLVILKNEFKNYICSIFIIIIIQSFNKNKK